MRRFIENALGVYGFLGSLFAILSLVGLVMVSFKIDIVEPMRLLVEAYTRLVDAFFWPVDPYLQAIISSRGWSIDHSWKHIFVVMFMYFTADTLTEWKRGRRLGAALNVPLSLALAFAVSVLAVTEWASASVYLPASIAAIGMVIYDVIQGSFMGTIYPYGTQGRTATVMYYLKGSAVGDAVVGVAAFTLAVIISSLHPSLPSVSYLLLLVVLVAGRLIVTSIVVASRGTGTNESWMSRFRKLASQRLGFRILAILLGTAGFLATGAGLFSAT